jgi:hypothetical protein
MVRMPGVFPLRSDTRLPTAGAGPGWWAGIDMCTGSGALAIAAALAGARSVTAPDALLAPCSKSTRLRADHRRVECRA